MDYIYIFTLLIVATLVATILYALSYTLIYKNYDLEKISSYECGFEAFEDTRKDFDVRFYLVSLLFIIFDLEITFLFPWTLVLKDLGYLGFFTMILFLTILTLGFIYEWLIGALDW
jgi:NADH:ubiquinone oxidoreductase subunit 3 (subunit A)